MCVSSNALERERAREGEREDGEHAKRGGLNRLYITITIALCMTIVCIAMNQHFTSMQKEKPSTR